jgi:glycosyltransferase involved in cell wall biosynthesis
VIVVCRNFTEVYNVACAIRAFSIVSRENSNTRLILAGDGPERKNLESLVASLGLENVDFLGNVPNEKMNAIYQSADIFMNTSRVDNMPNCILEAMACGLPVVSTNVGGIPYLVTDTKTGLLAPTDDSQALAGLVQKLVSDQDYAKEMVDAAHTFVQNYTTDNVRRKWHDYYRDLVS